MTQVSGDEFLGGLKDIVLSNHDTGRPQAGAGGYNGQHDDRRYQPVECVLHDILLG